MAGWGRGQDISASVGWIGFERRTECRDELGATVQAASNKGLLLFRAVAGSKSQAP